MKKHKFLVASILLVGVLSSGLFAQSGGKSTMEKLREYNWIHTWVDAINEEVEWTYEFSSEKDLKMTLRVQSRGTTTVKSDSTLYYLSNTIDIKFDESKVGKNQNGDYFIYRRSDGNSAIYKIVEITSTVFKRENIRSKTVETIRPVSK